MPKRTIYKNKLHRIHEDINSSSYSMLLYRLHWDDINTNINYDNVSLDIDDFVIPTIIVPLYII